MVRPIDGNDFMRQLTLDTSKGHYGEFMDGSEVAFTSREIATFVEQMPTITSPNEWVSVDERLPPPKQNVLAYSLESGIAEADYGDGVWMQYRWSAVMQGVTHWMPLPVPPEKEGENT